jgi:hypothetical protein
MSQAQALSVGRSLRIARAGRESAKSSVYENQLLMSGQFTYGLYANVYADHVILLTR